MEAWGRRSPSAAHNSRFCGILMASVLIVTPASRGSRKGNRVTADRWATLLQQIGHRVAIKERYQEGVHDVLIALHARKSAASISRFAQRNPSGRIVVALTGTDLYGDIATNANAKRSLQLATTLVLLQPYGIRKLRGALRDKSVTIYQSAEPPELRLAPLKRSFEICVLGHLRPVKDPFRAALAARGLPATSRIRISHLGSALSPAMAKLRASGNAGQFALPLVGRTVVRRISEDTGTQPFADSQFSNGRRSQRCIGSNRMRRSCCRNPHLRLDGIVR